MTDSTAAHELADQRDQQARPQRDAAAASSTISANDEPGDAVDREDDADRAEPEQEQEGEQSPPIAA